MQALPSQRFMIAGRRVINDAMRCDADARPNNICMAELLIAGRSFATTRSARGRAVAILPRNIGLSMKAARQRVALQL
jgi:hypothetical protein